MLKQVFLKPKLGKLGKYIHDPSSHTNMLLMEENKIFEPLTEQKEEHGEFCIEENNYAIKVKCKDNKK